MENLVFKITDGGVTQALDGVRLAPFHLLATEGRVHADKDHLWHLAMGERIAASGSPLPGTPRCVLLLRLV